MGAAGLGHLLHFREFRASDEATRTFYVPLGDVLVRLLYDRLQGIQMVECIAGSEHSDAHPASDPSMLIAQFVLILEPSLLP